MIYEFKDATGRPCLIDSAKMTLSIVGKPVDSLEEKALAVLLVLLDSAGVAVSEAQFKGKAWPDTTVTRNSVEVNISALRRILGQDSIRTVRGVGYQFIPDVHVDEPYEFRAITNDVTIDIRHRSGAVVAYTKRSHLKILHDRAYRYVEDMSADGRQSEFEVSPGVIESVDTEEGKTLIKTTFGRQRAKDEEFDRTFKCIFHDSFCRAREYWVERQSYPTDAFSITVRFPSDRPPLSHFAVLKQGTYARACPQATEAMIEGRTALVWKIQSPRFKESYKLEWDW